MSFLISRLEEIDKENEEEFQRKFAELMREEEEEEEAEDQPAES